MRDKDRAIAALHNFISELNEAWEAAGPPSYSRLEKLSERFSASDQARDLRVRVLAVSTTHDILTGKRRSLPDWGWVVSFVNVLRIVAVENALDPDVVGSVEQWKVKHQTARAIMREAERDRQSNHDQPAPKDGDNSDGPGSRGSSTRSRGPPPRADHMYGHMSDYSRTRSNLLLRTLNGC
jgi:hypothetical protein